jgi:hypothetical protein
MLDRHAIPYLGVALLAALLVPAVSQGQTSTTWTDGIGNWSTGANWSNGEPTAGVDAVLPGISGTAIVNMAGEVCKSFTSGTVGGGSTLQIDFGGTLAVAEVLRIGSAFDGTVHHNGGTVTAHELIVSPQSGTGTYLIDGGMLTVENAVVGGADASSGGFTTSAGNPTVRITGSLLIDIGGNFVFGAGNLNVGTTVADTITVKGAFQFANMPVMTTTGFVLTPEAFFSVTVTPTGISRVTSTGVLVLDGDFFVFDVLAPDGDYEILRGNPLQGNFDSVTLPNNDWSWRIEGNSVFIRKGDVPVEPTTWGAIKSRHHP